MIRRLWAIIGSTVFLVIAPGFVAGVVPWWISHWELGPPLFRILLLRFAGAVLMTLGAIGVFDSFARFVVQGVGTPAPVFPTRHLVISGLYRYVRNPMYVAVVSTIFGEALFLGNVALIEYGGLIWALFHVFVLAYEEPTLRRTFGPEYENYCIAVPRWIPRFSAWRGRAKTEKT